MQYILPLILAHITAAEGIQFDAPQWDKTLAHVDPNSVLAYNYVHEHVSMSAELDLNYQ